MKVPYHWSKRAVVRTCIILTILGIVVGISIYLARTGLKVREIRFIGDGMNMEINERLLSSNLLFFPSGKVRSDLLTAYPQFKDIRINKKFPDTIEIMPILRKPMIVIETEKTSYGVDEEGVVVDVGVTHNDLVTFTVNIPAPHMGTKIKDKQVRSGIEFYRMTKNIFPVSSLSANADGSGILAKTDKTDILFSQNDDTSRVIATLQTIMAGVRIKGTMPVMIDVRFSKPVIQW